MRVIAMKKIIITLLIISIAGCSSQKPVFKNEDKVVQDTVKVERAVLQPTLNASTAIKENSTLVAAVVDSVESLDSIGYKIIARLQTAIPVLSHESILEPGQTITIYPAFILNENKEIDAGNLTNNKLIELRTIKRKGYFIGNVSLAADNKYYITAVEVFSNPPEEINNEF